VNVVFARIPVRPIPVLRGAHNEAFFERRHLAELCTCRPVQVETDEPHACTVEHLTLLLLILRLRLERNVQVKVSSNADADTWKPANQSMFLLLEVLRAKATHRCTASFGLPPIVLQERHR